MTPPTKEQIQARMAETKLGHKKTARHFGISTAELIGILRDGEPPRSRDRARKSGRVLGPNGVVAPVRLAPLEWRNAKLDQLEEVITSCLTADRPNAVGIAALMKSAMKLRGEIDHLAALKPDDLDDATPEQIREYLADVMIDWPNEHLELAFAIYAERHVGRVLFISDGGHQSEFDAEEGWHAVAAE